MMPAPVARARTTDPETSHLAAAMVTPGLPKLWNLVLEVLREWGGPPWPSSEDVAYMLDRKHNNVSPVFAPMERAGLIVRAGKKQGPHRARVETWRIA